MPHPRTILFKLLIAASALLVAGMLQAAVPAARVALAASNCSTTRQPDSDSEEQEMLSLINAYRAQNGLAQLAASPSLGRSALWKSTDMAQNLYFSHDDLGRGWLQRLLDCGYPSTNDGEDLAEGYSSAQSTLEMWQESPPHNANLLSPTFHAIGIGRAESGGNQWYWTADFGPSMDTGSASSSSTTPSSPPSLSSATFSIGAAVSVNTPNDCLRVRASPSLTSAIQACLPDKTSLVIAGGPFTADGMTWWKVSAGGWVAGQYLLPGS